ncbi:hypothetical protein AB0M43_13350 [Longispora sp. NPDC051575]|uniref:hypothetical protein n=1 Tax=Longispora sp. NPDC051575 TaxID=3154943 RepID=UPI00343AEFAD
MTDHSPPTGVTGTAHRVRAGLRGAVVGLIAPVVAGAGAFGFGHLAAATFDRCDPHVFCLEGLVPGLLAVPVLLALTGPLAAWALRLRAPLLFALPTVVLLLLTCCGSALSADDGTVPDEVLWGLILPLFVSMYPAIGVWSASWPRAEPWPATSRPLPPVERPDPPD